MKKILALVLVPLVLLSLTMVAFAQENQTPGVPENETDVPGDPGVTPDSPLWGIDVALDRIRLALAGGPTKAKIGLEIAQERLLEIQAMGKKGNADAAGRAEEEHGKTIDDVKRTVDSLDGTPVENETLKGIEQGMANHLAALAKVKAKIEANPNIPEDVKAKLIAKFENLEGKAEELKVKIENKKEQIELKREARENRTGEVELEENETEQGRGQLNKTTGKGKAKENKSSEGENETD